MQPQVLDRLPNYPNAPTNPSPFENNLGEFINRCTSTTLGGLVDFTKTRGLVICGRKGSGKSHLLQKLALELAIQCQDEVFANERVAVPLLIRGSDMEAALSVIGGDAIKTINPILAYLRHQFQETLPFRNSFLLKAWKANRVVLMLDGLDDLVSDWWPLSRWLDLWQRESRLIIITMQSWHTELPPFHTELLQKIEIEPLDKQCISQLVEHRLMHHPRSEEIMDKITKAIKTLPTMMTEWGGSGEDAEVARAAGGGGEDVSDGDKGDGGEKEGKKTEAYKRWEEEQEKEEEEKKRKKEDLEKAKGGKLSLTEELEHSVMPAWKFPLGHVEAIKESMSIMGRDETKDDAVTGVAPHLLSLMIHLFRHQHLVPPGSFKVHGRSIS